MKTRKKRKKRRNWRKHRAPGRPHGTKEKKLKEEKLSTQYQDILDKLDSVGDPYENMDMVTKKTHALNHFYRILKVNICTVIRRI